jgi:hypothetical protein
MPTELQKLTATMAEIKRRYPRGGKRYSTIVENPFESGYLPLRKPTKADLAAVRRLKKRNTATRRHKAAA